MNFVRLALGVSTVLLAIAMCPGKLPAQTSLAQTPAPSLAEIAREVRAQRKRSPKASMVWTNYNLPSGSGGVSVVGQAGEKSFSTKSTDHGEETKVTDGGPAIAEQETPGSSNEIAGKLSQAKERVASLRVDLDLARRKLTLDQHQFDSNPGRANDRDGAAQLRVESGQLENKAREVTVAEAKVASLEQELSSAGAPAVMAAPPDLH
jgi:hypothetical protein